MTQKEFLDLVPRGILLINETGQIRSANTMALTDLGYTEEEIRQKSIFQINPHFNLLGWRRIWDQLANGRNEEGESELLTSEGVFVPHSVERYR